MAACFNATLTVEERVMLASVPASTLNRISCRAGIPLTQESTSRDQALERQLHRKDKALAETAALLVLTKKLSAVFRNGEDE